MYIPLKQVAALAGVSVPHAARLKRDGLLPAHVALGRAHRWNREEVIRWLAHGAPPRAEWEAMKASPARPAPPAA